MLKTIHTDSNQVTTTAVIEEVLLSNGLKLDGHRYNVRYGDNFSVINFQLGPVKEYGVNGVTNEALLAILIHRTKILDSTFPSDENKRAIQHMEEALVNFEVRTARRIARGVEGQNKF